ncbi:hypothetical protein Gotur_028474 [Gossypium turneri]
MRLSEFDQKERNLRKVIVCLRDMYQNYGTLPVLVNLKDIVLAHPDTKKRVDVSALSIYGLVVFPKALGHVDEAVTDLFDRLDKGVTPVSAILAETFRSLSAC